MDEGSIQTPNYPFFYGLDVACSWVIQAPKGLVVSLNITDFTVAGSVRIYRVSVTTIKCQYT